MPGYVIPCPVPHTPDMSADSYVEPDECPLCMGHGEVMVDDSAEDPLPEEVADSLSKAIRGVLDGDLGEECSTPEQVGAWFRRH